MTILLAVFIIASCAASTIYLNDFIDDVIFKLEQVEDAIIDEQITEASELCDNLMEFWEENEKLLHSSVKHSEIDEVSSLIASVSQMLKYSDETGIILGNLEEMQVILKTIKKTNTPTFNNFI